MTFNIEDVKVDLVTDTEKAFECLRWLSDVRADFIAVDVESDGLDWFDGKLRLVQFGTLLEGWAIPFELFPGLVSELMAIVEARKLPIVTHNGTHFDFHWLDRNTTWEPKRWGSYHNTMDLAAVIDSSGSKKLKDLTTFYVSPVFKAGEKALHDAMRANKWTWGTVPWNLPEYWIYGVLDTIGDANLFEALVRKGQALGVMDAYEVERGCSPALYSMERRGMLVDAEHCQRQITDIAERVDDLRRTALIEYDIENVNSGDQLIRAFLDNGVELTVRTPPSKRYPEGQLSMSKEAFENVEARYGKHPLVTLVSEYRKITRYSSAYYENFLRFQRSDDRIHPQFNQNQAKTGRMSAQFPAIQTMPRPDHPKSPIQTATQVRNSIVAEEGHLLVSTDFSNVEARIFAHFAQEQGMLAAFRNGVDIHGYVAEQVYHEWPELGAAPKDHPKRQLSKNTIFCLLFGGGPTKVAVTAGVDLDTAVRSIADIKGAFPGIKGYQKAVEYMAVANLEQTGRAWIRGVDDRILAMKETDDRYYAFTNWLIQGTATVILKQRLAAIHQMGLEEYCVAAIHDEVVSEVPDEDIEDYKVAIKDAMLDEHQFSVPIISDTAEPARRLGEAK